MCSKSVDLHITVRSVYKKWGAKSSVHCGRHDKKCGFEFYNLIFSTFDIHNLFFFLTLEFIFSTLLGDKVLPLESHENNPFGYFES